MYIKKEIHFKFIFHNNTVLLWFDGITAPIVYIWSVVDRYCFIDSWCRYLGKQGGWYKADIIVFILINILEIWKWIKKKM